MDSLSNKHLAIDASIWLHQFLRGMRDKDGQAIGNAHILGFYRRICKLLYFNIKPVFVFDGGTPALKRLTIIERRKQRRNNENMVKKTAERLLAAQLRLRALEQRKLARKKKKDLKALEDAQPGAIHDSTESPVYLEEVANTVQSIDKGRKTTDISSYDSYGGGSKAKRIQDKFILPPMEVDFDTLSRIRQNDERFGYQDGDDDVSTFLEGLKKEEGLHNIDSEVFKALPSEMQYEILSEIRQRSRVTSFERVQEMVRLAETPMDFSKLQVQGVIRRNNVTHKLLTVNQTVSKIEETVKPGRIASQRNRQYLLVKNEEGGWILGSKRPITGATADKPVQLDSDDEENRIKKEIKAEVTGIKNSIKEDDDEDDWESDEDDNLELVEVKGYGSQGQQTAALQVSDPKPNRVLEDENSLVNHPGAYVDEDESIEKVMAKFAEIEDEEARKRSILPNLSGPKTITMDMDEPDSLDTIHLHDIVHSDATLDDLDDFEDLMEDEETGEIISRKTYEQKQLIFAKNQSLGDVDDNNVQQRALSVKEECSLDDEGFHSYWAGYTPESFIAKHADYEFMLQAAITEWDDEQLSDELHSAKRKLEKSNVNDIAGVNILRFWTTFLESVTARRHLDKSQNITISSNLAGDSSESKVVATGEQQHNPKSRLVLLEDEDVTERKVNEASSDGNGDMLIRRSFHSASTIDNLKRPGSVPPTTTDQGPDIISVPLQLDFDSSILKHRSHTPADIAQKDGMKVPVDIHSINLESTKMPIIDMNVEQHIGMKTEVTITDIKAPVLSPKQDSISTSMEQDHTEEINDLEMGIEQHETLVDDEEGDEYEDNDAHNADLENEEQDFTNLFPDMATLPGALLISQEPAPDRTVEEQQILDEQEAIKMFEESKRLETEIKDLKSQHRKHQRNAEDLTESMVAETQMLLKLFGIPYIVAPMEAEAQCADLQLRGVVEGILTEDSDVFLFGGARVIKNVFREEKYVECYLMSDIERDLGVGRDRLVSLAYLLGSDYTTGIKGIGLITAMEILKLFPKLDDFAKWWRGEQFKQKKGESSESQQDDSKSTSDNHESESIDEEALQKLAKKCKNIHLPSTFPDPHISDAYTHPIVDDDDAKFQWGIPDLDGLRDYLRKSMGWDRGEVDRVLLPIIRQMAAQASQQRTQTTLDSFFDSTLGVSGYRNPARKPFIKSPRLRKVVNGLTGNEVSENDTGASDKDTKQKRSVKKPTSKHAQVSNEVSNMEFEVGMDSERCADMEAANIDIKMNAPDNDGDVIIIEEPKIQRRSRGQKTPQTKVPEAVTAGKRTLQSKDIKVKLAARDAAAATQAATPTPIKQTLKHKKRKNISGSSSEGSATSSGEDDGNDSRDFAPSHWDLLEERQRQQQQQLSPAKKKTVTSNRAISGKVSSLTAMVSASNAARYGSMNSKNKKEPTHKKSRP
ncbi:DNA repair protein rad2 [Linnemannia zychae]|nr:DNA repair protein rad2 [Linnemannia zychae]